MYWHLLVILHWISITTKKFEVLGYPCLCWPLWPWMIFLKQKLAFADKKLSTIDLFPTIRCQNQFPKVIGHSKSLCGESKKSCPTTPTKSCWRVPKKIHDYLLIINMPLILLLTFHYKYRVLHSFHHNQLFAMIQSCQYFRRN